MMERNAASCRKRLQMQTPATNPEAVCDAKSPSI